MQELWFLHSARCLMLIDVYIKLYEDSLNGFQAIERLTKFQGKYRKKYKCKSYGYCALYVVWCWLIFKRWAKRKNNLIILGFSYTTYFSNFTTVRMYTKLEDSGSNSRWKIGYDGFLRERKKMDK